MRQRTLKGLHEVEGLELVYPDEKLTKRGLVSDEEDAERTRRPTFRLILRNVVDNLGIVPKKDTFRICGDGFS